MKKVMSVFEQITKESSTNGKIAILKENADNKLLKHILSFNFSNMIKTNLSKQKINKPVDKAFQNYRNITDIYDYMDFLSKECTGKDIDIYAVRRFIGKFEGDDSEFLKNLAIKDIKIGLNTKTINTAIPYLIPEFNPMLAYNIDKYPNTVVEKKVYVTTKLDGNRTIIFKNNNSITCLSRQGHILEGLTQIEKCMSMLKDGYAYDGELIAEKTNKDMKSKDLYKLTSQILRKKGEKEGLCYHIFDMIPIDEFNSGVSKKTYEHRRGMVDKISENKYVKKVKILYSGEFTSEIYELLEEVIKDGEEGLMVNLADGLYEGKRSKNILKMKKFYDMDLKIVGYDEGTGALCGKLGSFTVEYNGNKVSVGSGFSDKQRVEFWKNRDQMIGRIISVSYFEESSNKKGTTSLRFPVFLEVRDNKEVSDN